MDMIKPHITPHGKAAKLFTPLAYDAERMTFVCSDQTLAFGFLMYPLAGADEGTDDRLNVLLNQDWPEGTAIQFSLVATPDLEREISDYMGRRMLCRDPSMIKEASEVTDYFRQSATDGILQGRSTNIKVRNFYIITTVKIPMAAKYPVFEELEKANRMRREMFEGLSNVGFAPAGLTHDMYVRLMQSILNWGPEAGWRDRITPEMDPNVLIRDQIIDWGRGIGVDKDGMDLEGKRVRMLSVKRYPTQAYFGMAKGFISDVLTGSRGLRDNFIITGTLVFPNSEKTKSSMENKRKWTIQQSMGDLAKFIPDLQMKKEGFEVLYQAYDDGDRPCKFYMGIALFSDSAEESDGEVSNCKTFFRDLGFQLMEDKYICKPLFLNCLPMGCDTESMKHLMRYRTFATRHAIPFLPIWGDWRGSGSPVQLYHSRNLQPMYMDFWDTDSSMNALICAQSGSGKSVVSNHIISSHLQLNGKDDDDGAQVWVIDVGRSYLNLCETYDGEFIEFSEGSKICLNPFQLVENYKDEADILVGLLIAMAAPNESLTDLQISEVKRHLKMIWDVKERTMTIDDVADSLKTDEDQRIRDVGRQLYAFTSKGEYGEYFYGDNNVNFNNRFCVLELEELKGRVHLQQVVLLQLIYQIQQACYLGKRGKRKILLIDEAWSLLTEGAVATFIEGAYRRFRKYGAAAICVTQSVLDLHQSQAGRAIAENSPHMLLLGQKGDTIDAVKDQKKLPLTDGEYTLLKTVKTNPPYYSEIFFINPWGRGIGRLILPPYYQLLYSTQANDVEEIRRYVREGMVVADAVRQVMADRGMNKKLGAAA